MNSCITVLSINVWRFLFSTNLLREGLFFICMLRKWSGNDSFLLRTYVVLTLSSQFIVVENLLSNL